ncbi:hypothetical protein XA68_12734 [Ophiocordyceps unilateralis]|uniref:Uncharacterized protein n=1 Tax=Ophiocordyceps unilateralis TaxID=268505 RepID=A0A2A9PE47_OPHUN|nr:hypothetical protein XA68_12734 [Ophiocordyceps unilateralis]
MANLPSNHPSLAIHLSDLTLTPLITSSSSPSNLDSLTSLASSAIASHTSAQRAHLGRPQRIMVEYPDRGPVVLHTYLDPRDAMQSHRHRDTPSSYFDPPEPAADQDGSSSPSPSQGRNHDDDGVDVEHHHVQQEQDSKSQDPAPVLVGIVVAANADDAPEARRAAVRLERVARDFQREWTVHEGSADSRPD